MVNRGDEAEGAGAAGPRETALWLVPCEADRRRLAAVIRRLAQRFGGPVFAPHVTVFGGVTTPRTRLDELLARSAAELSPCLLEAARLSHGPAFFQCVFLEIAEPSPVIALRRRLAPELGRSPDAAAHPHVSLLYGELAATLRQRLCRELAPALSGSFRFDALEVVAPRRDDDADWRDVEGWRSLTRYSLTGGADRSG